MVARGEICDKIVLAALILACQASLSQLAAHTLAARVAGAVPSAHRDLPIPFS
jgi:hypothetical protein